MKQHSILTLVCITVIIFTAVILFFASLASAGNDEEEDWVPPQYDTNEEQRYMELHLKTYGTSSDFLVHRLEAADEQNYKSMAVDRYHLATGGSSWHTFGTWETSEPLLKSITANRSAGEEYFFPMRIFAKSEAADGSTDQVSIRVTIQFGGAGQVQEIQGPKALNTDQYTKYDFDLTFSNQNINVNTRITVIVEAKTDEEYDPLNEEQDETITMTYGDLEHDTFFNFEANTVSLTVEKDGNGYIETKKVNGIAYANVSFIHAFGNELVDQDRPGPYYIRIYGPANESDPTATDWSNTINWSETLQYVSVGDMVGNSVPIIWQIQEDKEDKGVRAQYAPDNTTYFIYFKGWDIYPQNNASAAELNATFKVPRFPGSKERIELEWATGDVYFYNENGKRFDPTDDDSKGMAVNDKLYIRSTFKLGGGANPDHSYSNIKIMVDVLTPDENEAFNVTTILLGIKGGSYNDFQTADQDVWEPLEVGVGYKVRLWLNPDIWDDPDNAVPEYNTTNNYLEIDFNVYENRRPTAVITSPVETIEDDKNTYSQTGVDIHFDATQSSDPDTSYNSLDFDWVIETTGSDPITKDKDEFDTQLGPGLYEVTLTVSDGIRSDEKTILIMVNSPPKPNTGKNGIVDPEDEAIFSPGDTIRFTALYNDADADILYYTWKSDKKGGGGIIGDSDSVENFVEIPADDLIIGEHNISVTVEDKHGGEHVSEIVIYINNLPNINIVSPEDGNSYGAGEDIEFDASLSFDPEDGAGDMLGYIWYYDDRSGSGYTEFGYASVTERTFRTTGTYTIKVEVYDSASGMSFEEITIHINSKPIAKIGEVKGSGKKLTFDGSGSYDPDGEDIDRYIWDFDTSFDSDDDGIEDNDKDGEGKTTVYQFNNTGTFNISLTVIDEDGVWSEPVYMDLEVKKDDGDDDDALPLPFSIMVVSAAVAALVMAFKRKSRKS